VGPEALLVMALGLGAVLGSRPAWAGPPYLTDDPEPVDFGHWEFYAASQWSVDRGAATGTLPHVEVNYGALPEVLLSGGPAFGAGARVQAYLAYQLTI